jgi:hypothetical protein
MSLIAAWCSQQLVSISVLTTISLLFIIIITRWASKRHNHSLTYYDKDTLRHSLTSLQVGPVTASHTEAQNRYQASSDRLIGQSPRASVHATPAHPPPASHSARHLKREAWRWCASHDLRNGKPSLLGCVILYSMERHAPRIAQAPARSCIAVGRPRDSRSLATHCSQLARGLPRCAEPTPYNWDIRACLGSLSWPILTTCPSHLKRPALTISARLTVPHRALISVSLW